MNYCVVKWLFFNVSLIGDRRAYPIDESIMLEFYHSREIVKATRLEF